MKKAIWIKCNGEAHGNPHIDHCWVCMPWWGDYPTCPDCGGKFRFAYGEKCLCRECRKYYNITRSK